VIVAALLLVLWYAAHAALSFTGTCNMGSTDSFVAGAILGMPAAAIAAPVLLRAPVRPGWQTGVALVITSLALLVLFLWARPVISVGIQGHHLCGPDFDSYVDEAFKRERLIPLGHVVLASVLLVAGLRNTRRALRTRP
jgi:hypothetical protein